jgi:hypothetical protein
MKEYTIAIKFKDESWLTFDAFLNSLEDYEVGAEVMAKAITAGKFTCDIAEVIANEKRIMED